MPRHPLIETYLHGLRVLPADVLDELTDGLIETYDRHLRGSDPDQAARAAIEEFGTADQIVAAFVQIEIEPGRRTSRRLLVSGPLVGLCWGAALISSRAWTWTVPMWTLPVLAGALVTVIALLLIAASGKCLRHAALLGAGGLVLLDVLAISGALAIAPASSLPVRLAILASLARALLTARVFPALRPH